MPYLKKGGLRTCGFPVGIPSPFKKGTLKYDTMTNYCHLHNVSFLLVDMDNYGKPKQQEVKKASDPSGND